LNVSHLLRVAVVGIGLLAPACAGRSDAPTQQAQQAQQGSGEGIGSSMEGTSGAAASGTSSGRSGSSGSASSGEMSESGSSSAQSGTSTSGRAASGSSASGSASGSTGNASGAQTQSGDDDATVDIPPPMCPLEDANPPPSDGDVSACGSTKGPTAIFGASCEGSVCHSTGSHTFWLDLQSANVASRLLNVPSLELPCYKLIDPQYPDQSFLLLKVEGNPPAGASMPSGRGVLPADQIECIKEWVEAEAATVAP